jgi:hypothetical protein
MGAPVSPASAHPHEAREARLLAPGAFVRIEAQAPDGHGFIEIHPDGRALAFPGPVGGVPATGPPPPAVCALRLSHHTIRHLRTLIMTLPLPRRRGQSFRSPDGYYYSLAYRLRGKDYGVTLVDKHVPRGPRPSLGRSSQIWRLVRYLKLILRHHLAHPKHGNCRPVRS